MHLGSGFGRVLIDIRKPIDEDGGHQPLDPAHVAALAASMKQIGLIQPVVIQRRSNIPFLVAGRHRVAAARSLGWKEISAIVLPDRSTSAAAGVFAELIEIDENLVRRDLSDAVRAHLIARRKELYERIHPETKAKVAGGKARHRKAATAESAVAETFAAATSKATGRSERATRQDAARGKALGDDALKVAGTSLDKGVELDALAKLPPDERKTLIEAAARGEKVSARTNSVRSAERLDPGAVERVLSGRAEPGDEPTRAALREAVVQVVENGYRGPRVPAQSRKNPLYKPDPRYDAWIAVVGNCNRTVELIREHPPEYILGGYANDFSRERGLRLIRECRDELSKMLEFSDAHQP